MASTPRMATCGGFSIGVNDSMPRLPRLLTVKVAPDKIVGGDGALHRLRGQFLHPRRQFAGSELVRIADHGDQQPARVSQAKPMWISAWL